MYIFAARLFPSIGGVYGIQFINKAATLLALTEWYEVLYRC